MSMMMMMLMMLAVNKIALTLVTTFRVSQCRMTRELASVLAIVFSPHSFKVSSPMIGNQSLSSHLKKRGKLKIKTT